MSGKIFTITANRQLQPLDEVAYSNEADFQELIAEFPDLLAGDQIDPGRPRRWLLVTREAGVPDGNSTGRWSVDHLFLDQDAIPTPVEVKRSEDTRIRREVVGQLLEYAANAHSYWSAEAIEAHLTHRLEADSAELPQPFDELLSDDSSEAFWKKLAANLAAGKMRLIFVAERLPSELVRIIEFLNDQMAPAEVIGIELPTFSASDGGQRTIAPRVVGVTTKARDRKGSGERAWDKATLLAEIEGEKGAKARAVAKQLLEWGDRTHGRIYFGRGLTMGSFCPVLDAPGCEYWFFYVYTTGAIELQFQHLKARPPFDEESVRAQMLEKLNEIPGVNLPPDGITRRPSFPINALCDSASLEKFQSVIEWGLEMAGGGLREV
jgi:hypothetical protein